MYRAMVEKDTATLNRVHADDFVLTNMTGWTGRSGEFKIRPQDEVGI
jgi:hypothetical protein